MAKVARLGRFDDRDFLIQLEHEVRVGPLQRDEIAVRLSISVKAVEKRMSVTLTFLKKELQP